MAKELIVKTKFTAIDKFTATIRKMTRATTGFAKKTTVAFASVQRAERRLRKGFGKMTGQLGKLGLAFGGLTIMREIATSTIELDKNLASLRAITGVSGEAFKDFAKEIENVSKAQKMFTGDTAKAFEIVGSAKPELLANAAALGVVTDAAITLSRAGLMELEQSAKSLTGTMNQFGLPASESQRVINVLAAGAKEGSANITLLSESMDKVGAIANSSNVSLERTAGALELMSAFELKGAEAGISLKTTLLRLKAASLGFASGQFNLNDALQEYNKKADAIKDPIKKAAFEEKVFGKVHILTGQILTQNIDKLNTLTKKVTGTAEAARQAGENQGTLSFALNAVRDSFKTATTSTDSNNKSLNAAKRILTKVADNMDKIIGVVTKLIKVFLIYKAVMITFTVVTKSMAIATNLMTAAQWLLNVAMIASPIGVIVVAIAALIALVVLAINKYNEWGAALLMFLGPIGMIVNMVQAFRRNWEGIKKAFKDEGIIAGLKKIGATILDSVLMPLQQLFKLLSKLPGKAGQLFGNASAGIGNFRAGLGLNTETDEKGELLNPDVANNNVQKQVTEKTINNKLLLGIKTAPGVEASVLSNPFEVPLTLSPTNGWQ